MIETGLSITALVFLLSTSPFPTPSPTHLAQQQFSLLNRNKNIFINGIFSDNILLTLAYMRGFIKTGQKIPWDQIREPFSYGFVLKPNESFAFHDVVLDTYKHNVVQTTQAHFIANEGFKSDGWLVGDGVCHLASFLKVVAQNAGLATYAPSHHNFAEIADVPKSDGVSIYFSPTSEKTSSTHNLYITNTLPKPVAFLFEYKNSILSISVTKLP